MPVGWPGSGWKAEGALLTTSPGADVAAVAVSAALAVAVGIAAEAASAARAVTVARGVLRKRMGGSPRGIVPCGVGEAKVVTDW